MQDNISQIGLRLHDSVIKRIKEISETQSNQLQKVVSRSGRETMKMFKVTQSDVVEQAMAALERELISDHADDEDPIVT